MRTPELIALLRHEQYIDQCSTPGGRILEGEERGRDLGYRAGWNARAQSLIAVLRQGDVEAGLEELRQVAP